jgi:two-component system cell cycle response regulator
MTAAEGDFDCVFVAARFAEFDALRICSQLRSIDRTRFVPIILVAETDDDDLVKRGWSWASTTTSCARSIPTN